MTPSSPDMMHLAREIDHWRAAAKQLAELDMVASPDAWSRLESYVNGSLRQRLGNVAAALAGDAERLMRSLSDTRHPAELAAVRQRLLQLRRRYTQAETIIDFFGDAINARTSSQLGELLRGLDHLATDSMSVVLGRLGIDAPPALTYVDKGMGASILRAGVRLWDRGSISPVAAIKVTRHNLRYPTALLHETGHQVFHQVGWVPELGDALHAAMSPRSAVAADAWRNWASEVAADVHAFVQAGYGPVPALANVVDGPTPRVFMMPFADPHPFGWIRVMFNVALCRSWFGPGPWDELEKVWMQRHRIDAATSDVAEVARRSYPMLERLADVCTRQPMRAFGNRPLAELIDPRRVSPSALRQFAEHSGQALYTSSHLRRHQPLRILAWSALRLTHQPNDPTASADLQTWLRRLGTDTEPNPPTVHHPRPHLSNPHLSNKEHPWPQQVKVA